MRMRKTWLPWQQWAIGLGALGFSTIFFEPQHELMNTDIETSERMAAVLGSVLGPMLFGGIVSALYGLGANFLQSRRTGSNASTGKSDAALDDVEVPLWRGVMGSWWFSASALLLVATMLPLAFQSSPAEKAAKVMDSLRFSPFTGLIFQEMPALAAETELLIREMAAKHISEAEGWGILGPKLKSARQNVVNPAFRKASDASVQSVLHGSLTTLQLLSQTDEGQCRKFAINPIFFPDEMSERQRTQIAKFSKSVRIAYEDGKNSTDEQRVATDEEYSQFLEQNGFTQQVIASALSSDEGTCSFAKKVTQRLLTLPPGDQARFQRYLLVQVAS